MFVYYPPTHSSIIKVENITITWKGYLVEKRIPELDKWVRNSKCGIIRINLENYQEELKRNFLTTPCELVCWNGNQSFVLDWVRNLP